MDEKQKNTETKAAKDNPYYYPGSFEEPGMFKSTNPATSMEQTQLQAADAKKQAEASVSK